MTFCCFHEWQLPPQNVLPLLERPYFAPLAETLSFKSDTSLSREANMRMEQLLLLKSYPFTSRHRTNKRSAGINGPGLFSEIIVTRYINLHEFLFASVDEIAL